MKALTRQEMLNILKSYKIQAHDAEIKYYENPTEKNNSRMNFYKKQCRIGVSQLVRL